LWFILGKVIAANVLPHSAKFWQEKILANLSPAPSFFQIVQAIGG